MQMHYVLEFYSQKLITYNKNNNSNNRKCNKKHFPSKVLHLLAAC